MKWKLRKVDVKGLMTPEWSGADFDPATLHDWHVIKEEWASQAKHLDRVAEERISYGHPVSE